MTLISTKDELPDRRKTITVAAGAWSGIAGLFMLQSIYALVAKGAAPVWDRLAPEIIVIWGSWAILTPFILFIVRGLPVTAEHPGRALLLHVPIGIGFGLLHSLMVATVLPLFLWRPSLSPIRDMFAGRLASAIAFETVIYFLVVAVLYAFTYATESRQREIAIERAEAGLARSRLEAKDLANTRQQLDSLLDAITSRSQESLSIVVPARDGVVKLPVDSVDWLQAEDNYVRLHAGGRSHLMRTTLGGLEKRLHSSDFVRVHRSAVVRVSRIAKLRRLAAGGYAVVLTTGVQLRVGRAYTKRVIALVRTPFATK